MSLSIDVQFAPRMGPYLKGFKHTGGYTWTMRCPFCGDSKKNKVKRRAGFFRGKDETSDMLLFSCFNCSTSTTLSNVIKQFAPDIYDEYRFSIYRETNPVEDHDDEVQIDYNFFKLSSRTIELTYDAALDNIHRLDKLSLNHPAVQYIAKRAIPKDLWHLFYFAPKFMTWTNTLLPGKFELRTADYPRLIIPFFNEHGRMFAFAARAFGDEIPKYYTIKMVESEEKIYGRERLDYSKPILATEGQIDAILLPNCIGVSGSSFDTPFMQGIKTNVTLCPDNEPRNSQIVAQYRKYIEAGYRICMLPESFAFKDINEAIQGGMTQAEIVKVIDENSYQGFAAKLRFAAWQKCGDAKSYKFAAPKPECKSDLLASLRK